MALFCRTELAAKKNGSCFVTDKLSDAVLAQETLKRATAGAALRDNLGLMPQRAATVLWETTTSHNPPACIRAVKPKLWLVGRLSLTSGKAYILD